MEKSFLEDKNNSVIIVRDIEELQKKEINIEELLKTIGISLEDEDYDINDEDSDINNWIIMKFIFYSYFIHPYFI